MLAQPLVAAALAAAVGRLLNTGDTYSDHLAIAALPHLLVTLLRIVERQPTAHAHVLSLVISALDVAGAERPDAARGLLRVLLALLLAGRVAAVLDAALAWAKTADPALARFFALQVRFAVHALPRMRTETTQTLRMCTSTSNFFSRRAWAGVLYAAVLTTITLQQPASRCAYRCSHTACRRFRRCSRAA